MELTKQDILDSLKEGTKFVHKDYPDTIMVVNANTGNPEDEMIIKFMSSSGPSYESWVPAIEIVQWFLSCKASILK